MGQVPFQSSNFVLTNTIQNFNIGTNAPGQYVLKVQNGNYGPFLAAQCQTITDATLKSQCLFNNLIEKATIEYTRVATANGNTNGAKFFGGKNITRTQAYFEEPVTLTTDNALSVNVQAFPTATLKMAIDAMDPNTPPHALFSVTALSGTAPASITFNGAYSYDSNGSPLTYAWDFGDGVTATGVKVTHSYTTAGTFNPQLTVTNGIGITGIFSASVVIKAPGTPGNPSALAPTLKLAVTYPDPTNLQTIHVSLSASSDPNPGGVITTYAVNFGDGTNMTGPELDHTYAADGTYQLVVKLTNDSLKSTSKTTSLSISSTNDLTPVGIVYGNNTYYGPVTGTRTITDTFTIPAANIGQLFQLTIKNADGLPHVQTSCTGLASAALLSCQYQNLLNSTYVSLERATAVSVTINGKAITDSTSINNSTAIEFNSIVALAASNTIVIKITGPVTSYAQFEIQQMAVASKTPANLSLTAPAIQSTVYVNTNPAPIQVVVAADKPIASATINGQTASIIGSTTIAAFIPFTQDGLNNITVQSTDIDGNISTLAGAFYVTFVMNPPVITLGQNIPTTAITNHPTFNLPVTVSSIAPTTTTISVAGIAQYTTTAQSFTAPVNMVPGVNNITAQSVDAAGNISAVTAINITLDTTPPQLLSSTPPNGSYLESPSFPVSGTASKALSSVTVNGVPLKISNGTQFSGTYVAESLGSLTLSFVLTDLAGNVTNISTQTTILVPLLNPSLVSTSLDVDPKYMWIIGVNSSARPGATLYSSVGLFGINNGSAVADSNGAFKIRLKAFTSATLTARDTTWNESAQMTVNFLGLTTISGNVQDSGGNPLIGATVSISNNAQTVQTDIAGNFIISNPSTGDQLLAVDGSTVTPNSTGPAKTYSVSHLAVNVGIGQKNVLNNTIYMNPIPQDGSQPSFSSSAGGPVTSNSAPNVQLNIPAGAANFPSGGDSAIVTMVKVPSKYVTTPVPKSFVPTTVVALEPSGTQFSQPVQLTLPNENSLPAGTPMVIFSMNSAKGRWEVDGMATVDSGGQNVVTNTGSGITHFSSVYAVPLAPMIAVISNPNLSGIDVSQGGISEVIKAPSFKVLGQTVTPSITYKSLWANPTAFVSANLQIPNFPNLYNQGVNSGAFVQYQDIPNCWDVIPGWEECRTASYKIEGTLQNVWQQTNMWIPQTITSQFFVGSISTDQPPVAIPGVTDVSAIVSQINNGTPITNAAATALLTQVGIPSSAVVAYALQLTDPSTGQYLSSGIHPSIAEFQIQLASLTITTSNKLVQGLATDTSNNSNVQGVNNVTTNSTQVNSALLSMLPQDLQQDILVQNKSASPSGRGWQVNGAERIYNPTNTKVMIEESSGAVSTYALNNAISTLYNGTGANVDLANGVDISQWPTAYMVGNDGIKNSWVSQVNLSASSASAQQMGALTYLTGQVANQGYANCTTVQGTDALGTRNMYSGTFSPTMYNFNTKFVAGGIIHAGNGQIFLTNSFEHSLYSFNGLSTRVTGALQNLDDYLFAQSGGSSYFNYPDTLNANPPSALDQGCNSDFGFDCTNPQPVSQVFDCDLANSHYGTQAVTSSQWRCDGQWWGCDWYLQYYTTYITVQTQAAKLQFATSTGQIGVAGNDNFSFNSPKAIIGSPNGQLIIADFGNNRVQSYDPNSGIFTTIAGNGQNCDTGGYGNGGPATSACIYHPQGLAYDSSGNLYISSAKGYIRMVDTSGNIHLFGGKALANGGISGDQGAISSLALNNPMGMAFDSINQYLYIADNGNNRVLQVNMNTGIANKVAGNGQGCAVGAPTGALAGDGGPALYASVCPTNVGLDDQNNLVIVDSGHNAIRRVVFNSQTGGALAYAPSSNDSSRLFKNPDGTWTRQYRSGNYDYFDKNGYQTQSTDRLGRTINFTYDGNYNLQQIKYPTGQATTYDFSSGMLGSIKDPTGRTTTFNYNGNLLSGVTFPDGTSRSFFYDTLGQMTSEIDPRGNKVQYTYNAWNRVYQIINPDSSVQTVNDITSQLLTNNSVTGQSSMQNPGTNPDQVNTQITNGNGGTTKMLPDFSGFTSTIVDAMTNTTTIIRDLRGHPTKITKPDTSVTTMTYDPVTGDNWTIVDQTTKIIKSQSFDIYGNVRTQTVGDTGNLYPSLTTVNTYDANTGLLLQTQFPAGNVVSYKYNSQTGLVLQKIVSNNGTSILTSYSYDGAGNVASITDNGGNFTTFTYDLAGNQLTSTSTSTGSNSLTTVYTYDAFNRLRTVTSPKTEITVYDYYPTGELRQITDPKGNVTSFNYDQVGRLKNKTDMLGMTYTFGYDGNGNRTSETDPNGNSKSYTYDPLNRMSTASFPDDSMTYHYDLRGNVDIVTNSVSQITTYTDTQKRVKSAQTVGLGALSSYPAVGFTYQYDDGGNRLSNGVGLSYTYDSDNRLSSVSGFSGNFQYGYDNVGRLAQISRPGGISTYSYTPSGGLASILHNENDPLSTGFVDGENLSYDSRNFPTVRRSPAGQEYDYSYDANGQLVGVTNSNLSAGNESFTYDSIGNRLTDAQSHAYGYDSKGQRLLDDGVYTYLYDNNGNVTSKINHDSTKDAFNFAYNSKNQLIQTQVINGTFGGLKRQVNYTYDAIGRRMQKSVSVYQILGGATTTYTKQYVYDSQNIIFEYDGSGSLLASFTHNPLALDDVLAVNITSAGVIAKMGQTAGDFYYLKDHLGSITSIADGNGKTLQKYDYRSFGKVISITDVTGLDISKAQPVNTALTFTGREYDEDTGLFYLRARYLDPGTGRFLQQDPHPGNVMSPIGMINKYIYGANNPLIFTDPTGQDNFWNGLGQVLSVVAGAVAAFYGGAAIAALLGLAGTAGAIVGGLTGAFIGGAVTAGGFALSHGDPMTGFEIGVGVGLLAGGVGGYLGNAALSLTPYQVTSGQVFNAVKGQAASAAGNAFAGGSQLVNAGAAASGIGSAPVWGYLAGLANTVLPYVVGAADIAGTAYTYNCIQSGTCSSVLPQNPSTSGSWSF